MSRKSVRREIRQFLDSMKSRRPGISESITAALGNVNLYTLGLDPASVGHGVEDEVDAEP